MAIGNNYVPLNQPGNGVTTQFTGNWSVFNEAYITVVLEDAITGIQTVQTLGVNFTATFDDTGFIVTFIVAPHTGQNVIIGRSIIVNQTNPYKTSKGFQGAVLEASLDKLTGITQDIIEPLQRNLKFPLGHSFVGLLPDPVDDSILAWSGTTGLIKNGPTTANFLASTSAAAASAAAASTSASNAAASAVSAANSALSLTGTSATSNSIGTGAKSFTTQTGKLFNAGGYVLIVSAANPTVNNMFGTITSYSGTSLVTSIAVVNGSGTFTDWIITIAGARGAQGATGAPGAGTGDMIGANNLSDVVSATTSRVNLGLGTAALQANGFFAQASNNLSDLSSLATAITNLGFVFVVGTPGSIKLPGGLILKWAYGAATAVGGFSNAIVTATFDAPFPTNILFAVAGNSSGQLNLLTHGIITPSLSGVTVGFANTGSPTYLATPSVFAIGN